MKLKSDAISVFKSYKKTCWKISKSLNLFLINTTSVLGTLVHMCMLKMVEWKENTHIVELGLSMLAQTTMLLVFWFEAFQSACYVINTLPTHVLHNFNPYTKLYNKTPNFSFLRVFGYAVYPHLRPYNTNKLQFRSAKCVYIRYSPCHKRYKCLHILSRPATSRRRFTSRDGGYVTYLNINIYI